MRPASEYANLTGPGAWTVYRWEAYDPASKVDLCASALSVHGRLFFVDPIPLTKPALGDLIAEAGEPAGVVITNGNHARAADDFRRSLKVPLASTEVAGAQTDLTPDTVIPAEGGPVFEGVFEAVPVEGGAPGEVALYRPDDGGLFIVGDAIINLPSFPFALLPNKYCGDPKTLRRSLARLLERPFERMLFAHGEPLMSRAHERLAGLLAGEGKQ